MASSSIARRTLRRRRSSIANTVHQRVVVAVSRLVASVKVSQAAMEVAMEVG